MVHVAQLLQAALNGDSRGDDSASLVSTYPGFGQATLMADFGS